MFRGLKKSMGWYITKYRLSKKRKNNSERKQREILGLRSILLEVLTKFFDIYSYIVKVSRSGVFEK